MPQETPLLIVGINYPPEPTGIAPYTSGLASGLVAAGRELRVLTSHPHYPQWRILDGYGQWRRDENIDAVPVRRLLHYVPARPRGLRRLFFEISFGWRAITTRWGRPSVVVTVSPALIASAMVLLRARLFGAPTPVVVWVQDLYGLGLAETGQGGRAAARVMAGIEGWLLRNSDRVVVIHDRFALRVCADFGVDPSRVAVVRNWSHIEPGTSETRQAARARLGWGPDEFVVLHAGNMGVKQGLTTVVEAALLIGDPQDKIRFVLMGDGAERALLEREGAGCEQLSIIDPVSSQDFPGTLAAADLLLVNELTGVAEMAVPSKLTSYFAAGRPVLAATDEHGITAAEVRAADAGVVVAAGDPSAILHAVRRLAAEPERIERLGANGLRYRDHVLSSATAIESFDRLLAELSGAGGAGRERQKGTQ